MSGVYVCLHIIREYIKINDYYTEQNVCINVCMNIRMYKCTYERMYKRVYV